MIGQELVFSPWHGYCPTHQHDGASQSKTITRHCHLNLHFGLNMIMAFSPSLFWLQPGPIKLLSRCRRSLCMKPTRMILKKQLSWESSNIVSNKSEAWAKLGKNTIVVFSLSEKGGAEVSEVDSLWGSWVRFPIVFDCFSYSNGILFTRFKYLTWTRWLHRIKLGACSLLKLKTRGYLLIATAEITRCETVEVQLTSLLLTSVPIIKLSF